MRGSASLRLGLAKGIKRPAVVAPESGYEVIENLDHAAPERLYSFQSRGTPRFGGHGVCRSGRAQE